MFSQAEICFCTLAMGQRYRAMAIELAADIAQNAPAATLVVYTDDPSDFQAIANIRAFRHQQQGILHCYHDKLFLLDQALSLYPVAICIDADTHFQHPLPENLDWKPGITCYSENLIRHVKRYRPQNFDDLERVAKKLELTAEQWQNAAWIGEALFVLVRDRHTQAGRTSDKARDFLRWWDKIGRYMELKSMYAGEGNFMGLAAAKVGLPLHTEGFEELKQMTKHWDASRSRPNPSAWTKLRKRLGYHYRLNRARLQALADFGFYYR